MKTALLFVFAANLVSAPDSPKDEGYLTEEGRLTGELTLTQLQGGFAGFTGVRYTVAPDGSWTVESLFKERATTESKGKFSAKELAKLADVLTEFDLTGLPEKSGKAPGANPHQTTIEFGDRTVSRVGQVPPTFDPDAPAGSVDSRFAGICRAVKRMVE